MAICEEEVLAATRATPRTLVASRWPAVALALAAGTLFAIHLDVPAFFDNEGRYAEVAREMVLRRDWLSPHLDFTLFLNKPPLTFWLAALVFEAGGPSEWARLVPVAAAVVALLATCRLGALLYGEATGLVAGIMLATGVGFVLEARTLRPDMIVVATVVTALFCWQAAERRPALRTRWLLGLYAALGVGMLAKGFVPVVLAALPIAAVTFRDHGWRGVGRLRPGLGVGVIAAIVLPWHVAMSLEHPGFAWDYVVNQHLLFFLDRKVPRDSEGDSLAFFWAAFVGRSMPWSLLLPLALPEALRGARSASPAERATFLLTAWLGGVMLFFSCAPSRLEHYSLPALPAVALLGARIWERARAGDLGSACWTYFMLAGGVATVVGLVGLAVGSDLVARTYWIAQAPGLPAFATVAGVVVAVTGAALLAGAARRRPDWLLASLALGTVPLVVIVLRAEALVEPLFSWRPLARAIAAEVPPETEIVFEAPEEYQLVGGLVFYTGRRITLLEPPGFVPPTYLAGRTAEMFLARPAFTRRWRAGEPLAFVSDPQRRREDPGDLVPGPFRAVGRFGDRWLITSVPAAR